MKDFQAVAPAVAEHELARADRIEAQRVGHHQRQGVDRLAHVVVICGKVHHALRCALHQRSAQPAHLRRVGLIDRFCGVLATLKA